MIVILSIIAPYTHAQRYSMETQVTGGFLLLDNVAAISSTDFIACGHTEQGFRYNAICRVSNGSVTWSTKSRNSYPYYANCFLADLCIADNNDMLVAGQEVLSSPCCHLARLNPAGDLLWSLSLNIGPYTQHFSIVCESSDGSIYAAGSHGDYEQADMVVAKFSPLGDLQWARILDQPGEQFVRRALVINDTLHVLGYTEMNGGDLSLFTFSPEGTLTRHLSIGTSANENPLGMDHDGTGALLISYALESYDQAIVRVGSNPGPTLSTWSIDTPLQLDLQAGLHVDPVTEECILMGNRVWMAFALRISLVNSSVVWERSFPDFYSFFGMSMSEDGTALFASGGPFGYLPSGSYPAEFARLDPSTGNDKAGVPCITSPPSVITITQGEVPYSNGSMSVRTPVVVVYNGIETSDMPLLTTHCPPTALPIELISWSAEPLTDAVRLSWSTASEWNNERFIIERSSDADDWEAIGEIRCSGNSAIRLDYAWQDISPMPGANYYRLLQQDHDGNVTPSSILAVVWSSTDNGPLLYPNPASPGQLVNATVQVTLYDLLGKQLGGPVDHFLAPDRPGVYLVRGKSRCERLVVQ